MKPIIQLMYIKVKRDVHSVAEVIRLFNTARNLGYRIANGVPKGFNCGGYVINHKDKVIRGIASPHTFYTCNHREATVYEAIDSIQYHTQEKSMKPRKHAELIKAWADGAEIQVKNYSDKGDWWTDVHTPGWYENDEYRIKPETTVYYSTVVHTAPFCCPEILKISKLNYSSDDIRPNLKLVMDDEGKLISAEVI